MFQQGMQDDGIEGGGFDVIQGEVVYFEGEVVCVQYQCDSSYDQVGIVGEIDFVFDLDVGI